MSEFKRYYNNNNIVFITIVTYDRKPILIDNIDLLRSSFKNIKYKYNIIAGIILPDHLHILLQSEKAENFSKIIAAFKAYFSQNLPRNNIQTTAQKARREKGIWQRKYFDHIIRDENDFNKHLDYIHYNSMKHLNIVPKYWEYSSFKKFVKLEYYDEDWCNIKNINNILEMNLE